MKEKIHYETIAWIYVAASARELILQAIEARFQVIPEDMASKMNEIRTRETLKSLHREAVTCQSIDSFRKAVSEASAN